MLDRIDAADVVVFGHGPVVDKAFIEAQHVEVDRVAEQIRTSWCRGDTVEQALASQDGWPFPVEGLRLAVERGYPILGEATQI